MTGQAQGKLASIKQLLFFAVVFLAVRGVLSLGIGLIALAWGLPRGFAAELLNQNEIGVQALSLFSALFAAYRYRDSLSFTLFLKKLLPWSRAARTPVASRRRSALKLLDLLSSRLWRGFALASVGMALVTLAGFSRFERAAVDLPSLFTLIPLCLLQLVVLTVWVLGLELSRRFLLRAIVQSSPESFSARLMIVGFEAHLWFLVLNPGFVWLHEAVAACLCGGLAAALLISTESELTRPDWRARTGRASVLVGFWGALFHVYGYSLTEFRGFSLVYSFPGPLTRLSGFAVSAPLFALSLLLLLLTWGANPALRREFGAWRLGFARSARRLGSDGKRSSSNDRTSAARDDRRRRSVARPVAHAGSRPVAHAKT